LSGFWTFCVGRLDEFYGNPRSECDMHTLPNGPHPPATDQASQPIFPGYGLLSCRFLLFDPRHDGAQSSLEDP
jgi:hypothetical protein